MARPCLARLSRCRKSQIDDDMSDSNLETVYGNNKVNRSSATGLRMPHSTEVPSEIVRKWQEIVNLLAEIIHVPSALIMRVEPPNIKVFVSSESNGNPYEPNEVASLNTGLYCETVMNTRKPLLVPDALIDEVWKSNPDIKLGMISYLGMPIV